MKPHYALLAASCVALGACGAPPIETTSADTGFLAEVPENVLAIAGPGQNLNAVTVLPEDGCYWYQHRGPVETTLLPLRTSAGNPICTGRITG